MSPWPAIAAAATLAVLLLGPVRTAGAGPQDDLAKARAAVVLGQWTDAIPLLTGLLYPRPALVEKEELIEVHAMLGVALFMTGNTKGADRELQQALFYDPDLALSDLHFPREAIAYFESRRKVYEELARKLREDAQRQRERVRLQSILDSMVIVEKRPFYINFLPLGAGQFQNGQRAKGTAFLVSQAILGGASVGLWTWQVTKFGFGGSVPSEEVRTVQRVQQLQIVTGSAALVLIAWGIVDAMWFHRPTRRLAPDPAFLPEKLRKKLEQLIEPEAAPGGPPGARLGLSPALIDGGAGLVFVMEF